MGSGLDADGDCENNECVMMSDVEELLGRGKRAGYM
jgi:hypothetical protein